MRNLRLIMTSIKAKILILDEAASFVAAASVLKKRGAYKIYVVATHGLLSGESPAIIEDSCIDQVFFISVANRSLFIAMLDKL